VISLGSEYITLHHGLEFRHAGARRRGSGAGAEPPRSLRRGAGTVGHMDAGAARRGRPAAGAAASRGSMPPCSVAARVLEDRTVFGGHLPVPAGGTGYHSPHGVSCRNRRAGNHRDGPGACHHQALGASTVHPDIGEVPPPVGDRERDVPDTGARDPYRSGHGSGHGHSHLADVVMTPAMPALLTARARRHRCPPSGGAREAPEAQPMPVEQAAQPVPDLRHPGLADPVSRDVRADGATRTLRNAPRRTLAARPTPEPPRSRPSPKPVSGTGQPPGRQLCAPGAPVP